jgi:hypothetical protein
MQRPGWEGNERVAEVIAAKYEETVPIPARRKKITKDIKEGAAG